jgi:predicted DNA-binding protein
MARRRVNFWLEEEVYEDYRRLATALGQPVAEVLREAMIAGLPDADELERDYQLPADLLRSRRGVLR